MGASPTSLVVNSAARISNVVRQLPLSVNVPFAGQATDVDLAPDAPLRAAMLAGVPLTFAPDLDPGAVDQQVQRALQPPVGDVDLQALLTAAEAKPPSPGRSGAASSRRTQQSGEAPCRTAPKFHQRGQKPRQSFAPPVGTISKVSRHVSIKAS
jgi:hypothetical protein